MPQPLTTNHKPLSGWLFLDKPTDMSSAQAVGKVKRLLNCKKMGHAGTLDPLASGVLALAVGEATKTMPYVIIQDKCYEFTVTWGEETETGDVEGEITHRSEIIPTEEEIRGVLPQFTGTITQTPPIYSAIKIKGKAAYAYAREGKDVSLPSREVTIYGLSIKEHKGNETSFSCHVSKGTYIRSLATDMAKQLGTYGHVTALRRTKIGRFDLSCTILLEKLEEIVNSARLCTRSESNSLIPVTSVLDDIPVHEVTSTEVTHITCGRRIQAPGHFEPEANVFLTHEGEAVALAVYKAGQFLPKRVFVKKGDS